MVDSEFPPLISIPGKPAKPPYGFTPVNQQQYEYITSNEEHVWAYGNRGSGKSTVARWCCHARATTRPGYRYAILRTSFPELIKSHLIYLGAEMEALGGKYNASKFIAYYPNGSIGFFGQAETDDQVRNVLGVEMFEVVFDESSTFLWSHIAQISASVRVPANGGLVPLKRYLSNPTGTSIDDHWAYFIDKEVDLTVDSGYRPQDWRAIKLRMEDNAHLDVEAYKRQLSIGLPEHLRKAWLEGERFDSKLLFELKPTTTLNKGEANEHTSPYHVIEELPQFPDSRGNPQDVLTLPWVRIQGGYDDGYIDPAVMLWFVEVGNQLICFNERVETHMNSPDLADMILDANVILTEAGEPYQLPLTITYGDPVIAKQTTSVQSTQEVMESRWRCLVHGKGGGRRCCEKARGLRFEPSTNSRELYASAINRLLQAEVSPGVPKVQFLKPNPGTDAGHALISRGITGCPYLLKYLPKMQFDENDPRKMADHKHDHPVIAFAYRAMAYPIHTAPRAEAIRPIWWDSFFIKGTNIPKPQSTPKRRY